MPLISVDDLRHEMAPAYSITDTSHPSAAECERFIEEIESEVQLLWTGAGGIWPDETSPGAIYPRLTVMLGTKWRYLDAKYNASAASMVPDAVAQARLSYNDRLGRIKQIAEGASAVEGVAVGAAPKVGYAWTRRPRGPSSFAKWTELHDREVVPHPLPGQWSWDASWW